MTRMFRSAELAISAFQFVQDYFLTCVTQLFLYTGIVLTTGGYFKTPGANLKSSAMTSPLGVF